MINRKFVFAADDCRIADSQWKKLWSVKIDQLKMTYAKICDEVQKIRVVLCT